MKTNLFDYILPSEKIAQHPLEPRDSSRLLMVKKNEEGSSSSGNGVKAERREVEPGIQVNSYAERANTFQGNDNGPGFRVADVPATQGTSLPGMTESSFSEILFRDITSLLRPDDILVINDTRVMPARIRGHVVLKEKVFILRSNSDITSSTTENGKEKEKQRIVSSSLPFGEGRGGVGDWSMRDGKTKAVECLFLRNTAPDIWEIMCFPGERLKTGREIILENGMTLEIVGETYAGRLVRVPVPHHEWLEVLQKYGEIPLPPYITEHLENSELYQTVYAENLGSTASPTAGRHFTPELLQQIQDMGVKIARVTLHIGPGTFKPIYEDDVTEYQIHSEFVTIPHETLELLRNRKGRVIAVGTTSMRSLESFAAGKLKPVIPEYRSASDPFSVVDESKNKILRRMKAAGDISGIQVNSYAERANTLQGNDNGPGFRVADAPATQGTSLPGMTDYSGNTDLYVTPGYQFQLVDVLITNFHAPRTSLLVLVAAFMGLENMQAAYQYALDHDFRFLSFGDAMWVERDLKS